MCPSAKYLWITIDTRAPSQADSLDDALDSAATYMSRREHDDHYEPDDAVPVYQLVGHVGLDGAFRRTRNGIKGKV